MARPPSARVTKGGEAYVESDPDEDPDWDFARNRQVLLKGGLLEFSASTFDAPIPGPSGPLHGPNRDFSWQGLLVGPLDNRIYRVLDGIHYSPLDGSDLRPLAVRAWRSSVEYIYDDGSGRGYRVSIGIRGDGRVGRLSVRSSRPTLFVPLFDLRDAEVPRTPTYSVEAGAGWAVVRSDAAPFPVRLSWKGSSRPLNIWVDWVYKLGDGFRYMEGGDVRFVRHVARVHGPLAMESEDGSLDLEVPLPNPGRASRCRIDGKRLAAIVGSLSAPPEVAAAIALRMERLASFGIPLDGSYYPEAGSMWFRRPWTRDIAEGLRWNSLTYVRALGCEGWFSDVITSLLRSSIELGGLPVTLGGSGAFAADAFPQLLNASLNAYELTGSASFLLAARGAAEAAASALRKGFSGCALLDGLVLCPANSSWIDVVLRHGESAWPSRLPLDWLGSADPFGRYALVEVNALYIESYWRLSRALRSVGERSQAIEGLLEEVLQGYRSRFYSPDRLPPLVYDPSGGRADWTRGSPAVEAVAVLKDIVYSEDDLRRMWPQVEGLIVRRRMVALGSGEAPFGIVARETDRRPYLGDAEYHGYVVWPRDTPYLIKVMAHLSMDVDDLLLNNLDHMIAEGALGYASELFSAPLGGNPSPGPYAGNPVPVKNPAQYWSHWCDPYLQRYWRDAG